MALKPPPLPNLRSGFRTIDGWAQVKDGHNSLPSWTLWIRETAADGRSLPIYVHHNATQAEVDRAAFSVCRKIDESAGRPVKK